MLDFITYYILISPSRFILVCLFICSGYYTHAQNVSINANGQNPDNSAMLDVSDTTRGVLIPRLTLSQRNAIVSPATGLLIYQSDNTPGFYYNEGSPGLPNWAKINTGSSSADQIVDVDNNTRIEVEQTTNDDLIRFTQLGTEFLRMDSGRIEIINQNNNIYIGQNAGLNHNYLNNASEPNLAIGSNALALNTNGSKNIALGYNSLSSNLGGYENVAIGNSALELNSTGSLNTAIGAYSLRKNTSGFSNTTIGRNSMVENEGGIHNTFMGETAGLNGVNASQNTGMGSNVLFTNVSGSANTSIGYESGYLTLGSGNVFLGNQAGYNETGSNTLYIDNSSTASPLIYGDFASDSLKIFGILSIGNSFSFPDSDGNFNEVLTTNGSGQLAWQSVAGASSPWTISGSDLNYTAGNVGIGTASPNASLSVNGSISRKITSYDIGTSNNISNLAIPADADILRITGPNSNASISGFVASYDGRFITFFNASAFSITFESNGGSSSVVNRMLMHSNANLTLPPNSSIQFVYSTADNRWIEIGYY